MSCFFPNHPHDYSLTLDRFKVIMSNIWNCEPKQTFLFWRDLSYVLQWWKMTNTDACTPTPFCRTCKPSPKVPQDSRASFLLWTSVSSVQTQEASQ